MPEELLIVDDQAGRSGLEAEAMDDLALLASFLRHCNESANDVAGSKSHDQIRRWLRQRKTSAANSQACGDADEEPAVLLTFDFPLPGMKRDQQCDIALAPFARDNIPCLAPKGKVIVRAGRTPLVSTAFPIQASGVPQVSLTRFAVAQRAVIVSGVNAKERTFASACPIVRTLFPPGWIAEGLSL